MKELVKKNLEKYDYKYSEERSIFYVKLGLSLEAQIDFSHKDKCIITDRLKGRNYLTGMIEMSLKGAVIYNAIGLVIVVVGLFFLDKLVPFNLVFVMILISVLTIIRTTFYLVKTESFKIQVMNWI